MTVIRKRRRLEVGRESHLKHIGLLFRRTERLRIRAAQRHQTRIERIPELRLKKTFPKALSLKPRYAREIGKQRHIGDRHRRDTRGCHPAKQLSYSGRAVLRLLHGKYHEVKLRGSDLLWRTCMQRTRQTPRDDLHQAFVTLDRHPDHRTLGIKNFGCGVPTHEGHVMACYHQFGR